jgi:hypothetical protein
MTLVRSSPIDAAVLRVLHDAIARIDAMQALSVSPAPSYGLGCGPVFVLESLLAVLTLYLASPGLFVSLTR